MPSYLVTGASRGLGYALVKLLAADSTNTVIGLVRDLESIKARLAEDGISNVHIVAADITDASSLARASREAEGIVGDAGLDVLINNAAYISQATALKSLKHLQVASSEGHTVEKDPQTVIDDAQKSFDVNVFGVLQTVFAFLPLIKKGALKKVVAISSGMGDIDFINETKLGNAVPYAVSKAALSTLFAKLNATYESQGILFISMCPGLVDTAEGSHKLSIDDTVVLEKINAQFELYAPGFKASEPLASAASVFAAINRSSIEGGQGGSFLSHNGTRRWM